MDSTFIDGETLKKYKLAGQIAGKSLLLGKKLIMVGGKPVDVLDKIEDFILSKGAGIAFPSQISFNTTAAHECATDDDTSTFKDGDMIKLDVGVHVDGFVGDNALTINLGETNKQLRDASKKALESALKVVRPGIKTSVMGKAIQDTIIGEGFRPIHNLSGHGIGKYKIHTFPSIPNIDTGSDAPILKEGMAIACEPFATDGKGEVQDGGMATVFMLTNNLRNVRSPLTRPVLQHIKTYEGLPFTTRWLTRKFGDGKAKFAIKDLIQQNIIHPFPPLVERGKGIVSQHEHSIIVLDKPIITTMVDDD